MQSMNCGGVVSAGAELLFIITIYKELLSHMGEDTRERAEQHDETEVQVGRNEQGTFRRPGKLIFNFILFSKWCCNVCSHTPTSLSSKIFCTYLQIFLPLQDVFGWLVSEFWENRKGCLSCLNQCWVRDVYTLYNGEIIRRKDLQKFPGKEENTEIGMWREVGKAILASIKEWAAAGDI